MTTPTQTTPAFPQSVAVIGASTSFGSLMLERLETALPDCQLVAIDSHPLLHPVKQVSAYRMEPNRTGAILTIDDIPEVMQMKAWDMVLDNRRLTMADVPDVLHLESVDSVIHLGAHYDRPNWAQFLSDSSHWVQACRLAGVRQLVFLSDVRVYGVRTDNPIPLTERSETQPAAIHRPVLESEQAVLQEGMGEQSGDGLKIVILRTAMTVGPGGSSPAADEFLWPAVASNRNRDFPLQFLHQHDLTRAIQSAVAKRLEGIYHVASKGIVSSQTFLELCRSPGAISAEKFGRTRFVGAKKLAKHPLIVSSNKFRQTSGFAPAYSSEQAARAYCHSYLLEPNTRRFHDATN